MIDGCVPTLSVGQDVHALAVARDALARFAGSMEREARAPGGAAMLDLSKLAPAVVDIVESMLGQGAVTISASGSRQLRANETVFAGVWRVSVVDAAGTLVADRLEAAPIPRIAIDAAHDGASDSIAAVGLAPRVAGAAALLADIRAAMRRPRSAVHVINLTLYPLTSADRAALDVALPRGCVEIVARAFGNCRIASTLARDVWRVAYYNAVDAMVLNTIEVVDVPEIALAAPDDLDDSRARLAELVEWMGDASPA